MAKYLSKQNHLQVIEESKALEKIGRVVKSQAFPEVLKNVGFVKLINPNLKSSQNDLRKNLPMLQLAEDTFKTLPSLRHSSYQIYRQNSSPKKEKNLNVEPLSTSLLWRHETILNSPIQINMQRNKRTQIIAAESLFGTMRKKKEKNKDAEEKAKRREKIEKIFERIQKRSDCKAKEHFSEINKGAN